MPIYQYACENCGYQKEALQKISDPVLVDCTECNTPGLRKQVTAAAFRLKGTGWYETDFKNPQPASQPTAQTTASPKETSASGAKADS